MIADIKKLYNIYIKTGKVTTDSRNITPGCIFFALKGENFDGNTFAAKALEEGASLSVIDNPDYEISGTMLVNNALTALQQLAEYHRMQLKIPVLAITGSNGKTTTKELISSVLRKKYIVTATTGNLNNHIGVPLTVLSIGKDTEIAIIEMGANHQGEIAALCQIAKPDSGLVTNIGKAHLGGFGGFEGVIKAKSELYQWLRNQKAIAFVNGDNPMLIELSKGINCIYYGKNTEFDATATLNMQGDMLGLDWKADQTTKTIKTNLVGAYNFDNVLAAICTGKYFDVSYDQITEALTTYQPTNSRSQSVKTAKNRVILDAYNANPSSMKAAIENFGLVKAQKRMVILGDMLELGSESQIEHKTIINLLESNNFDDVVLIGPEFATCASAKFHYFINSDEALIWLQKTKPEGFAILVKGSRGIRTEKVMEAL